MNILYRIYQLFIALPLVLLSTGLTCLATIVGCTIGNAHFWGYWPAHIWGRVMCHVMLLPVHVEGRENLQEDQSYVFVANHQGPYDIFLVYGFLGRHFKWMMKKQLRNLPLVGKACESSGQIFVDKSGPKSIQRTYDNARRVLKNGTSLMVFPEGARTFTGHMGIFRRGAFQLADELQLPVVPVTIDGTFDVLPRQKGVNFLTWHRLRLVIHKPIPSIGQGADNIKHAMSESYDTIMQALPLEYQGYVENLDQ